MNIVIILLAVIALSEIGRLYLTHRKVNKKRYFRQKLEGVERLIYDLEFKAFKTREIREDIRKEYSMICARL